MVLRDLVCLDGAECSESHMQRDIGKRNALVRNALQQLLCEVQSGRRRGGGAGDAGIDRLIALAVGKLLADIGRKRHLAEALEQLEEDPLIVELHQAVAALLLGRDRRGERAVAEREFSTGMQLSARLGKAFPDAAAFVLQKQQLHGSARRHAVAEQARGQHARIVHHKAVARLQVVHDIIKMPVLQLAGLPVEHHQAGAVAPLQRCLCDELLRQIIVKITGFQEIRPFPNINGISLPAHRAFRVCGSGQSPALPPADSARWRRQAAWG